VPNVPTTPGLTGPWGPGIYDTQGPIGQPVTAPITVQKAWNLLLRQLGVVNVKYAKDANSHLRAVNALTRHR